MLESMVARAASPPTVLLGGGVAASTSAASVAPSSFSRVIDTKGLLKIQAFHGERETFPMWRRMIYSAHLTLFSAAFLLRIKKFEEALDTPIRKQDLTADELSENHSFNTFLLHVCKGDAENRIHAFEDEHGLEGWRALCKSKLARFSTAAMKTLIGSAFVSKDPRVNIGTWEKDVSRFELRFSERVQESMRKTVYQEKIASTEMHPHLLLRERAWQFTSASGESRRMTSWEL